MYRNDMKNYDIVIVCTNNFASIGLLQKNLKT